MQITGQSNISFVLASVILGILLVLILSKIIIWVSSLQLYSLDNFSY